MPYNCEDCGQQGARMNSLFEIRLCVNCSCSNKYKLICKSKAMGKYLLTNTDIANGPNPPKEYRVKNPHYKSGPPMTLYLESEIEELFLLKYNDLITNILMIQNPHDNIEKVLKEIENYFEEQKNIKKSSKHNKILSKYNIEDESDLPVWVQLELSKTKSGTEYERVISSYLRFVDLKKLLAKEKLFKYIDHKVSHEYIYQTNKEIKLHEIPNIIRFMLEKKKQIKEAIKKYNIPTNKYHSLISNFINSYDFAFDDILYKKTGYKLKSISNDLDTLVEYIVGKETRTNDLITGLKSRGLVLRNDSVLCSKYIEGESEYELGYIIDTMEQMDWFFTNTKYSQYSKEYDNDEYQMRKSYYDSDYNYYRSNRYYDSDDSDYEEERAKEKEIYNKNKSEYVKKRCLEEWIKNGKKGIYPQSLIPQIEMIENELENELENEKNKIQNNKILTPKTYTCSNKKCSNLCSKSCKNKKCRLCCDGCKFHKYLNI